MEIKRSALVAYSQADMFALVNDISAYPNFIPWCTQAEVLNKKPEEVTARLTFAKSGLHKSFTTCNTLQPNQKMTMQLVEGPFKYLRGVWQFEAKGDAACQINLTLSFKFSSALTSMAFGPLFNQVANKLVDAFCQRAQVVYGQR